MKMSLFFFAKQIISDLLFIEQFNPSIHVENLLDEIGKLVNLVSFDLTLLALIRMSYHN